MWEDPDESGDTEPLNSKESSLPVGVAYPPPPQPLSEGVNPALPEEAVMASAKAVSLQDNAEFPWDLVLPPLFASRSITTN